MAEDWSKAEVRAIVDDYLSMLAQELRHEPYNKTEHRRALKPLLQGRTEGSIERKHQNISAALIELGFPYVPGYKPLSNYQQLLFDVVAATLLSKAELPPLAQSEATRIADTPVPPTDVLSAMVTPPRPAERNIARSPSAQYRTRLGVDYLALEARNRSLGTSGEHFVAEFERVRLRSLGKPKLAERIEVVSDTRGDGAGFDVLSFETSGKERFIEVKTTGFGKETPFFVTRNELSFSIDHTIEFQLYRLFQFRTEPKLFALVGRLDKSCSLDPAQYIARTA